MGRKKIVIKRLAEDRNRNVTFLKRKAGLMKKAWELSVLCGAEVSVIVFNSAGKLFEFSSASSVELAIDRYHSYAGPVERRKPEEFIAQQAAGGADNSDDDEEIAHQPVPSGSGAAAAAGATAGGVNNGGAPITASGNMSLRGRDEWKEATVPSYAHVQGGMQDDDRIEGGMHHGSALDGGNMSGVGPVDPRLTERQPFGAGGGGGHQSSFNHHHHHHHQPAEQQQQDHPSFRLSRESEEIMEQQRRAEQYRFLQMQTQMNGGGIPSGSSYGGGGGNDAAGLSAPSWMGMGRNRQRSDLFDGGLDAAGRGGGGGEQLTSWAAMRSGGGGGGGARTPSITSNAAAAFPQSGPGGNQPSLNSLYASQRLDAHSAQGTTSPTRASMVSHGPSGGGGGGTGSDAMSRGGVSPASRHGLPAENISAGEFTGSNGNGNAGGAGLDFYTSYHLPPAHGVNADGTLDWQRTAAAAQLQAALQAQQAQLAYLRQQKAQQVQWQDLVAASGMDNAVHQLHSRLAASSNQQHGQDHGGGGGDSRGSVGLDYAGRYTPRGEQNTAPSTASFTWPGAAGGGGNTNEATTGGSWYNTLQEPTHSSRTSDLRLPHPVSEDAGRGPSADQRGRALSYAIESEETSPVGAGVDEQEDGKDGRKRRMMEGDEDDEGLLLDGREGDARKRSRVASS
ncbi:hypothetical protein QFC21_002305 [Naganishia friedmannii]|uniref:Uncharacterized protein n=1 Tax=Naganishia friedmannii TaxID=89922 RepID=A0ACC2VXD9_9TREE|nr:hypothetical protein QFC21_002305 [Naganishia friedmannii]